MVQQAKSWTVLELLNWSTAYFEKKGIENPRLNAERLLSHNLACDRVGLYMAFDRFLNTAELGSFKKLLLRRAAHEPLQYIVGEAEFYSLRFKVNPHVLIPRPETEILVERALSLFNKQRRQPNILDVGTGSGIIAVTLAKHLPNARLVAIDTSEDALQVASENAALHDTASRIKFVRGDILDRQSWKSFGDQPFAAIVSNPPYIGASEASRLAPEVREFEPKQALFVEDPLLFYRSLAVLASQKLDDAGFLMCEIAPALQRGVVDLFQTAGLHRVQAEPDLAGKMRLVVGWRKTGIS